MDYSIFTYIHLCLIVLVITAQTYQSIIVYFFWWLIIKKFNSLIRPIGLVDFNPFAAFFQIILDCLMISKIMEHKQPQEIILFLQHFHFGSFILRFQVFKQLAVGKIIALPLHDLTHTTYLLSFSQKSSDVWLLEKSFQQTIVINICS